MIGRSTAATSGIPKSGRRWRATGGVLLISADFLASAFCVQEEVPALLKRQEEQGMLLIPVLLKLCVWKAHRWLKDRQMLPRDGKCVAIDFANNLADAAVAEQVLAHFERLVSHPAPALSVPPPVQSLAAQRSAIPDPAVIAPSPAARWPVPAAECIDLTHLPATRRELFGRDEELKLLDAVWSDDSSSRTRGNVGVDPHFEPSMICCAFLIAESSGVLSFFRMSIAFCAEAVASFLLPSFA
jgi:hypothetical protein